MRLSATQASQNAGMKKQQWSDYENDRARRQHRIETLKRIALGLGVPYEDVDAAYRQTIVYHTVMQPTNAILIAESSREIYATDTKRETETIKHRVQTVDATFDGISLRPDTPLPLEANTRVRLTVETLPDEEIRPRSFLRTARSLQLEGPSDWSANLDHYLYGAADEPTG